MEISICDKLCVDSFSGISQSISKAAKIYLREVCLIFRENKSIQSFSWICYLVWF